MEFRSINSLSVSAVGLGCNNFGRKLSFEESKAVVDAALEEGVNLFDTADRYGYGDKPFSGLGRSEEFLGKALGPRRGDVIVATKFGNPMSDDPAHRGGKRSWVLQACEDSLRRLGTDYIDLYQIHRPDKDTPVAETLGALAELMEQGKVREAGCSNFTGDQMREAEAAASSDDSLARFVSVQNEYSLIIREPKEEVLPLCREYGIAFLPYFPLASGLLTGKYSKDKETPEGGRLTFWNPRPHLNLNDSTLERVDRLSVFAQSRGHTLLELAFGWQLSQPEVTSVVAGATRPAQVLSNVASAGWQLTAEDFAEVDRL